LFQFFEAWEAIGQFVGREKSFYKLRTSPGRNLKFLRMYDHQNKTEPEPKPRNEYPDEF
jgi:hypothetical protein